MFSLFPLFQAGGLTSSQMVVSVSKGSGYTGKASAF